jgi:hypothetical protein
MKYPSKPIKFLSVGLTFLLIFPGVPPPASAQTMPTRIDLVVVEGEGASSSPGQQVSKDPVVKVEDENHQPVGGVAVVFTLPVSGTTGEFSNGDKTLTMVTENSGLAAVRGLKTNQVPGKLQIYVTASYRGLRARTLITQLVEGPATARGGGGKLIAVLAVVGAAAAGGAVLATRKKTQPGGPVTPPPTPPAPIGITPGSPGISPPR